MGNVWYNSDDEKPWVKGNAVTSRKEIHRWVVGWDEWERVLYVACATLILTPKQIRIKGYDKRDNAQPTRQARLFHRACGYREKWDRDCIIGYKSKAEAIAAFRKSLMSDVESAERELLRTKDLLADVEKQLDEETYKEFTP